MLRQFFILILTIMSCGCSKTDNSRNSEQKTNVEKVKRIEWVNFKYKAVKGYVTQTPWTDEPIVANDKLSTEVSDKFEIELNSNQEKRLVDILSKVDPPGQYTVADCFYPRHGFVFWDSLNRPTAFISICFECNKIEATPKLNKVDLSELEVFCREIGLPVFDTPIDHKKYFDSLDRISGH
jgi:hypothetical protein